MSELLGVPYSPWSEKAKWALDVRRVPYRYVRYQPFLGEPALKKKLQKKHVTVPVFTDDSGRVYDDSAKIARFADEHGDGPVLFPKEHDAEIAVWVERSERALAAGRALSLSRTLKSDASLKELSPRWLRRFGPVASLIAGSVVRRTLRKYGADKTALAAHEANLRAELDALRAALSTSESSPKTLLGSFTFADIAAAQMVTFVCPPSFGIKIGAEGRKSFTDSALAAEYHDVIAWRDALYDAHRPKV